MKQKFSIAQKSMALTLLVLMLISAIPFTSFATYTASDINYDISQANIIPADVTSEYFASAEPITEPSTSITKMHVIPETVTSEYGLQDTVIFDDNGNRVGTQRELAGESADVIIDNDAAFPAEYNSLGQTNAAGTAWISPVKDQGYSGNCWAFAAISAAEAAFIRNNPTAEGVDFSEAYLAYLGNRPKTTDITDPMHVDGVNQAYPHDRGGNALTSGSALARWTGPVHESMLPPCDFYGAFRGWGVGDDMRYIAEQHLTKNYMIYTKNMAAMKSAIQTYGGVFVTYYHHDSPVNHIPGATTYYQYYMTEINHAVYCVGWNDNIPATAFKVRPNGNGAWLMKNSWGEGWGNGGGYFWLSYYDTSLYSAWVMDFQNIDIVDNNYQFDGSWDVGFTYFWFNEGYERHALSQANMFHAKGHEYIKQVGVFTYNEAAHLLIDIYKNPTDPHNPETGTHVCVTATDVVGQGYRVIDLPHTVELFEGERFAIVVRTITTCNQPSYGVCEYKPYTQALPGQSYYKDHETNTWIMNDKNSFIKAFTEDAEVDTSALQELYDACLDYGFAPDENIFMIQAGNVLALDDPPKQRVTNAYKFLYSNFSGTVGVIDFDGVIAGAENIPSMMNVSKGSYAMLPTETPYYPGWAFIGWSLSGTADNYYYPGQTILVNNSMNLKAIWRKSDGDGQYPTGGFYAVYYDPNGGSWDGSNTNITKSETQYGLMTFGAHFDFPAQTQTLTRTGYRLQTDQVDMTQVEFWSGNGNGRLTYNDPINNGYEYEIYEAAYKGSVFMVDTDRVPYGNNIFVNAAWDPIITYVMNDGSDIKIQDFNYITGGNGYTILGTGDYTRYSSSSTLNTGREADTKNTLIPNREGYNGLTQIPESGNKSVVSWNTRADGTGTTYSVNQVYEITEPLTLYAIWEESEPEPPAVTEPTVSAEGAVVTVSGLSADVKDVFLALGEYDNYTDVNNNKVVRLTQNKLQGAESYDYTVPAGGVFTVLVRYNDGTMKYLYVTVNVIVPEMSANGLQVTVSNLEGVKVIRTAYGEYKTAAKIKAAEGARAFTAKGVLKGVDQYTIQYRDNGIA
ncbi:MAG: InlB B-repeat-containing protein, partial [Clostridia bacterium]|nr:InlB B-repeat-containing protein [Clostridia bacterium]